MAGSKDSNVPNPSSGAAGGGMPYSIIQPDKTRGDVTTNYKTPDDFSLAVSKIPYRPPQATASALATPASEASVKAAHTIRQIYARPELKDAIENVAGVTGHAIQGLYSLIGFESSGGTQLAATDSKAKGPLQFLEPAYHYNVARYANRNMAALERYAPEAAAAFKTVLPYMKIEEKRDSAGNIKTNVNMDDQRWKADGHQGTIKQALASQQDNAFMQVLFTVRHMEAHKGMAGNPYYMRAVHNFGAEGAFHAVNMWAANPNMPIGQVKNMSPGKLADNHIKKTDPVEKFYRDMVLYSNEVTNEIGKQLDVPPTNYEPSVAQNIQPALAMPKPQPVRAATAHPPSKPARPGTKSAPASTPQTVPRKKPTHTVELKR